MPGEWDEVFLTKPEGVTVVTFFTATGPVYFTPNQMCDVAAAVADHVQACFDRQDELIKAALVLTDEQLQTFDVDTEW